MRLPVSNRKQIQQADCLAACAAMVLAYLGEPVDYRRLLKLLDIEPFGAPRRNIVRLSQLNLDIVYGEATLSVLLYTVSQGEPVIAFVDTGELSYWKIATNHAVVVVGFDGDYVLINDPAFDDAAKPVLTTEFELAWLNADYACAIIRRRQTESKED